MVSNWFTRAAVVLVCATALFTAGLQAQASPSPTARQVGNETSLIVQTTMVSDDVEIQASYTFSRSATERIYTAFRGSGIAGVVAVCLVIAPGWLKAIGCPIFGQVVAAFLPSHPPQGQCLKVSTRFGWPPIKVGYVNCV